MADKCIIVDFQNVCYSYNMLQHLNSQMTQLMCTLLSIVFCTHCHDNRYELMQSCWRSEPHARLNFTQLKYSFKDNIANTNPDKTYITIQPDNSTATSVVACLNGGSLQVASPFKENDELWASMALQISCLTMIKTSSCTSCKSIIMLDKDICKCVHINVLI